MNCLRLNRWWSTSSIWAILFSLMLGIGILDLVPRLSGLRKGIIVISVVFGAIIIKLLGRNIILYSLAIIWIIPMSMKGLGPLLLTRGLTAWELLLYMGVALEAVSGDLVLGKKQLNGNDIKATGDFGGIWIGLLVILGGSLLALSKINILGCGNFRYTAINPIFLFLLATSLITQGEQLVKFATWVCVGGLLLLVFQIIPGATLQGGRLTVNLMSPFDKHIGHANRVGLWASTFMPLALYYMLGAEKRILRLLGSLLYIAFGLVLFLTFSRGTMVSATVSCAIVALLAFWTGHRRKNVVLTLCLLTLIAVVIFMGLSSFHNLDRASIRTVTNRLESFSRGFVGDQTLLSRVKLWRLSFNLIQTNPFGIGYGVLASKTGFWEHNIFVLAMNGGGIIGLLGLLIFFGSYVVACIQSIGRTSGFMNLLCIAALGGVLNTMIAGITIEILNPNYAEPVLMVLALGLCTLKLSGGLPLSDNTGNDVKQQEDNKT